jgi:minor histocompatibility antigen H13
MAEEILDHPILDLPAEDESPILQLLGKYAYVVYTNADLVQMYLHLLLSALFPIYIGAYASLRRPPSAAPPPKKKSLSSESDNDDEEDDELEQATVEGLQPSDAILFPVLAGITLTGLYFLIKWLQDPALLNKILGYYFSLLGVVGVGRLAADALNIGTGFIFPNIWSGNGKLYHIDPLLSVQVSEVPGQTHPETVLHRKFEEDKTNPFPGVLSRIRFSQGVTKMLWKLRASAYQKWIFRGFVHGMFKVRTKLRLNDAFGMLIGVAAIAVYNLLHKPWWLTNLMGFGFCYGTLQIMSPTTFWTGSLVLMGLFVYDIVMVFYTYVSLNLPYLEWRNLTFISPLMITVATSLDVPIKLVFPGPKRGSMLGLGDVVLPGIMIALALRFDLYLHYLRQKQATRPKYTPAPSPGDLFWAKKSLLPTSHTAGSFKHTYFSASLVGYIFGMLVTLVVLNIWNHAQPALLYLVPGVLIAIWGTALVRGEVKEMWKYTEDGSLDEDTQVDQNGMKVFTAGEDKREKKEEAMEGKVEKEDAEKKKIQPHVFLFSLAPILEPSLPKKARLGKKSE